MSYLFIININLENAQLIPFTFSPVFCSNNNQEENRQKEMKINSNKAKNTSNILLGGCISSYDRNFSI